MQSKRRLYTVGYVMLFCAAWVFLFWKCRYGFANIDESFYLTIPYRFCQGDWLLTQEWHLSQTAFLLLVPAVRLHLFLFNGTSGILLHFRLLFTLVWGLAAFFFYCRLRSFSPLGAMAASLVFLLFAPFGIMALSYNSLAILLLLTSGIMLITARAHLRLQDFLSGLALAGAVLSSPLLLSLYLLFSIIVVFSCLRHKNRGLFTRWLFVSLGSGLAALLFLLYLFSRVSPALFLRTFPLMMADPDHLTYSVGRTLWRYCSFIYHSNRVFPYLLPFIFLVFLLSRIFKAPHLGFIGMAVLTGIYLLSFRLVGPWYINTIMFPLNLLGLYCALSTRDRIVRLLFSWLWIPGAIYTFCINITSNQEFYAISCASTVMTVASAILLIRFAQIVPITGKSPLASRKALCLTAALLLVLQLGCELSLRYTSIFWDSDMRSQTALALDGPEKGILMRPERLEEYTVLQQETQYLKQTPSVRKVLFLSDQTWLYLNAEKENSSFSAWLSGINARCLSRLDQYYAVFPEKLPDAIYVDVLYWELVPHFEAMGYQAQTTPAGACILTRAP